MRKMSFMPMIMQPSVVAATPTAIAAAAEVTRMRRVHTASLTTDFTEPAAWQMSLRLGASANAPRRLREHLA